MDAVMEFEKAELDELDLPPEFCHYEDEGCEVAASCLHCPLPGCIYDETWGKQRRMKNLRAREMRRLLARDKGTKEIAEMFGVTQRTVQRAVGRAKGKNSKREAFEAKNTTNTTNVKYYK